MDLYLYLNELGGYPIDVDVTMLLSLFCFRIVSCSVRRCNYYTSYLQHFGFQPCVFVLSRMGPRRAAPGKGPPKKRGPKPKKKQSKKLGKAATLPGELWVQWVNHVLAHGRCWLYMALVLCHLLCLRITECLRLAAEDFSFRAGTVHIAPMKRQDAVRKPMLPEVKTLLQNFKKKGIKRKRAEQKGSRGKVTWTDQWKWPQQGMLFPAERMDCCSEGRNKNTVCKAISRLRKTFEHPTDRPIRSHSGRQTMVNALKASGLPDDVAMFYARISDKQTYAGYGAFTSTQASQFLKKSKPLRSFLSDLYHVKNSKPKQRKRT